jgi:extracellular elastinolytic metalloproteinase
VNDCSVAPPESEAQSRFTEAAGNFQQVNRTGKGLGGDPVQGQSSDGANTANGFPDLNHLDNANMTTFPDGTPPIMQMYLFEKFARFGLPDVASANGGDDAEVVYHEYTHGLSNRLVLYPNGNSGLDNIQAGSMGEAWSDWYAEDFLNARGFKPDPPGPGNLVMGQLTFGGDLRSQPVDCPVGAPASICPGEGTAGSGGYTYGDFGKISGGDVHANGEIWLETLWDLRDALGSQETESLVTRAMELSPPSPSFLDMRNAIVQADLVDNGGAASQVIWSTFAHRGMGYFASSIGGGDTHPVQDFSLPPTCGPCFTISGTITDGGSGHPAPGVTVGVAGLDSGFGFDLADTTGADGTYRIRHVPPHVYPAIEIGGAGYEGVVVPNVKVTRDVVLNRSVNRDWASLSGGATLQSFTPPDYAPFCGSNANGAFDLNLGNGWPSDSVGNAESGVSGPRKATVKLPRTITITGFGVASDGTCGDDSTAAVKGFKFQTKTAGGGWQTSFKGEATNDGVLHHYIPHTATDNVVAIRFIMTSNYGQPDFMDVLEATVYGTL